MPSYPPRQCEDDKPKTTCDDRVTYSRIIVDAHLPAGVAPSDFRRSRRLEPSLRISSELRMGGSSLQKSPDSKNVALRAMVYITFSRSSPTWLLISKSTYLQILVFLGFFWNLENRQKDTYPV